MRYMCMGYRLWRRWVWDECCRERWICEKGSRGDMGYVVKIVEERNRCDEGCGAEKWICDKRC